MNEQNQQQTPNVYKTSKTTWILIGFMVVILGVIIFMMTRKKKAADGSAVGGAEAGASVAPAVAVAP
jgi:preprotein translocase subunit SecG